MTDVSKADDVTGVGDLPADSTSDGELLWVLSRSLLSAQETATDTVELAALLQYQQCHDEDGVDGRALDDVERRLDRAVEDIEAAKTAVRRLRSD